MQFFKTILFLLLANSLFANNSITDPFFGYKQYKEIKKDTKENQEDKFKKFDIVVTDELLETLTPEEFDKLLEDMKKIAVKRQNDQDIKNFLVMKNFTQKKADSFSKKTQIIGLQNQEYDLTLDVPKSKFAKNIQTQSKEQSQEDFYKDIRENAIIVVFYEDSQEVDNRAVEMILNNIYREKGIEANFMSVNEGFGKQFAKEQKIIFTPDIWILYKSKKPIWHRLASGVIPQNRIYQQIEFVFENVIKKELEK